MIYTKEVENMCPVHKGAYHGPSPIPQEGKWVQVKEGHIRTYSRSRLVRASAGSMQAYFKHQRRDHRRSPGGDAGMLRHDSFGRHGRRNTGRKDSP